MLPEQGEWVQSLVEELRFHMPVWCGKKKKKPSYELDSLEGP